MNEKKLNIQFTDHIAVGVIIAMLVMQLSLTKIFAKFIPMFNESYNTPAVCVIYVLMMVAIYALVVIPRVVKPQSGDDKDTSEKGIIATITSIIRRNRLLCVELLILLMAIISADVVTLINAQLRLTNILTHNLDYFYAFLALPILLMLKDKSIDFDRLLAVILGLNILSMAMRYFVSLYATLTGYEIKIISREYALEYWIRNGRLRVMPPCFIFLLIPLSIYLFKASQSLWRKCLSIASILMTIFYIFYVWQSRACTILVVAEIGIMLLFCIMSRKSAYIRWGICALGLLAFILAGGIRKLLTMFSAQDVTQYVGENKGHYYAYAAFFRQYLQSPIFGNGITETLANWDVPGREGRAQWMCDAGIIYSLVPMGILIVVFYVMIIARGIRFYIKNRKTDERAVLVLGLVLGVLGALIWQDSFFTPYAFSVPFLLAFLNYVYDTGNTKE